jgi:DnaJ-class molecular chaperone
MRVGVPSTRAPSTRPSPSFAPSASSSSARASRPARANTGSTLFATADDARGDASRRADPAPETRCPVCRGTGWKPCGQCEGTGINPSDAFGGKFKAGDACWLCEGKNGARTMCGNCVDLTDTF